MRFFQKSVPSSMTLDHLQVLMDKRETFTDNFIASKNNIFFHSKRTRCQNIPVKFINNCIDKFIFLISSKIRLGQYGDGIL